MSIKHLAIHKRRAAFTLIEMMVVIGLISIVVSFAVPSLKRIYEDFKIDKTFNETEMLISSCKSYYLTMNEFPPDTGGRYVDEKTAWCLPSNYYGRNLNGTNYPLSIYPYQGTGYDIDNWLLSDNAYDKQFYVSIYGNYRDVWYTRFQTKYPMLEIQLHNNVMGVGVIPGLKTYVTEGVNWRNRFY